jgi:hypothetical protein
MAVSHVEEHPWVVLAGRHAEGVNCQTLVKCGASRSTNYCGFANFQSLYKKELKGSVYPCEAVKRRGALSPLSLEAIIPASGVGMPKIA